MEISLNTPLSFSQLGQRANQEDSRWPDDDICSEFQRFFVVCDGVGGSSRGEDASYAVTSVIASALDNRDWSKPFTKRNFSRVLDKAYDALDKIADVGVRDMATTLAFVAFHAGGVMAAHIGDSRVYHIRSGVGVLYRSEDHSLVNAMVHSGVISPEQALSHPRRNVITRCITPTEDKDERSAPTITEITDIIKGDYFFLCSDGVLENIDDNQLVGILSSDTSDETKLNRIKEICEKSKDNNTAILIPVVGVKSGCIPEESKKVSFLRNLFS